MSSANMKSSDLPMLVKYKLFSMGVDPSGSPAQAAPAKDAGAAANKGKQDGGKAKEGKKDKKDKKDNKKGVEQDEFEIKESDSKVGQAPVRTGPFLDTWEDGAFGDLKMVQSIYKTQRQWVDLKDLDNSSEGKDVWIRARAHNVRGKGKTAFIVLRRGYYTVQCCLFAGGDTSADMVKFAQKIPNESIVDIYGTVTKAATPVVSCEISDLEIQVKKVYVVNASSPNLPFQIADASRFWAKEQHGVEKKESKAEGPTVGTDLRLDNRWIDLRTPANHAIFRLQSRVCQYYRQYFLDRDFVEIHSPKITPGVSEGGSEVFRLDYFGQKACLAQSPQLYKQAAVESDLFRVFEIGHVFRAENSNTHRHMCEFTGLDFEMEIKEHYHEILQTLGNLFVYIFDQINVNCKKELSAIEKQFGLEPLVYPRETVVIPFTKAHELLKESGEPMEDMKDLTTDQEKKLGKIMKAKYNTDFYIVDRYPLTVRPFYTMPCADDARFTNSYDVFLRGEEITSGAQRIHDVELLKKRAQECKIPASSISWYVDCFRFGAYPHGGAGIGLERVVMLFLGLDNIRKTAFFPRTPTRLSP